MNKNKKGFTLIELLAVIVILAIIALIAVPVIMNVITKARVSAFEDSAYGIVKAGEVYYSNQLLEPDGITENQEFIIENGVFTSTEKLDVSGSMPSSGKITVTSEGKVALAISNGEYCIRKATTESKVKAEKLSDLENVCDYKKVANSIFTVADGETSIPECIINNTTCSVEAIKNGLKVGVKVNDITTYDFYIMSDNTEDNEITLIMNQNLGGNVAWITKDDYIEAGGTEVDYGDHGNNNKGPITALSYLEIQTSNWTNIPKKTYQVMDTFNATPQYLTMTIVARARLITFTEATDLECRAHGTASCPTWLYANGIHWTSSVGNSFSPIYAWCFSADGGVNSCFVDNVDRNGIRPVITVSKTVI